MADCCFVEEGLGWVYIEQEGQLRNERHTDSKQMPEGKAKYDSAYCISPSEKGEWGGR